MMLRFLCSMMLLAGSAHLIATENCDNNMYTEAGTRALFPADDSIPNNRTTDSNIVDGMNDVVKTAAYFGGTTYVTTHSGAFHSACYVALFGENVTLEDGSIWDIHSSDSFKVMGWAIGDPIIVVPNLDWWFPTYNHRLVNQVTGESAEANLALYLQPPFHSILNHRVVLIDDFRYQLWLEDGSVWQVCIEDYYPSNWLQEDTVIIGINTGRYNSSFPNILINATNRHHVRATCIQN